MSDFPPPTSVIGRTVAAGIFAGLVAGLFHLVVTEPVIQQAIDLESLLAGAAIAVAEPEIVTRPMQRAGLIAGYLLIGLTWGVLLGLVSWLGARVTGTRLSGRALAGLTVAAYWTIGLFPLLKFPASPPGVGDPETIGYRQGLYFGFLALSALAALLAAVIYRDLGRIGGHWGGIRVRAAVAVAVYLVAAGALALFWPANPDPVTMPPALAATFRVLAIGGTTVFWLVLGASLVWLWSRRERSAPALQA